MAKKSVVSAQSNVPDVKKSADTAKNGRRIRIFSALEVSSICGVVNQTVINWIRSGFLKAFTTPGGQYRVYASDLLVFLEKRGMGESIDALRIVTECSDWQTVLIASDSKAQSEKIAAALRDEFPGQKIVVASTSFNAGKLLGLYRPGFIILDAALEGISVAAIREEKSFGKPYIILIKAGKADASMAEQDKPDAVLHYPPDLKKLAALVREKAKRVAEGYYNS
ncbi:MAG: helix-turn-helix domain-containing protein [Treponema sp.]|jgi:hypothetical protein|nr:helix-turn-helix domain-containing protein [Treponema sp.]